MYIILITKNSVLKCLINKFTKWLYYKEFRWVKGVEHYIYINNNSLKYKL
jgi:hypothetical protein